jgi:hypothetical protein
MIALTPNQAQVTGRAWDHTSFSGPSRLHDKDSKSNRAWSALRRLSTAVGQLRSEIAVAGARVNVLASIEDTRPLTPEEKAEARRLKAEGRRLFLELKALTDEYALMHEPRRSR